MDIKESDSQFEDKQALETAITSLQKILEIIKSVNSTSEQATIDEKNKTHSRTDFKIPKAS